MLSEEIGLLPEEGGSHGECEESNPSREEWLGSDLIVEDAGKGKRRVQDGLLGPLSSTALYLCRLGMSKREAQGFKISLNIEIISYRARLNRASIDEAPLIESLRSLTLILTLTLTLTVTVTVTVTVTLTLTLPLPLPT